MGRLGDSVSARDRRYEDAPQVPQLEISAVVHTARRSGPNWPGASTTASHRGARISVMLLGRLVPTVNIHDVTKDEVLARIIAGKKPGDVMVEYNRKLHDSSGA